MMYCQFQMIAGGNLDFKHLWKTILHEEVKKDQKEAGEQADAEEQKMFVFEKIRASLNNHCEPYSLSWCVGELPED